MLPANRESSFAPDLPPLHCLLSPGHYSLRKFIIASWANIPIHVELAIYAPSIFRLLSFQRLHVEDSLRPSTPLLCHSILSRQSIQYANMILLVPWENRGRLHVSSLI